MGDLHSLGTFFIENWWLVLIIPATLGLKKFLHSLDDRK